MARHRQSSPECPFVLHTSDNVPCGEDAPAATTEAVNVTIPEPEDTDDVGPATPRHLLHPAQLEEDASPASRSPELGLEEADYRSEVIQAMNSLTNFVIPGAYQFFLELRTYLTFFSLSIFQWLQVSFLPQFSFAASPQR